MRTRHGGCRLTRSGARAGAASWSRPNSSPRCREPPEPYCLSAGQELVQEMVPMLTALTRSPGPELARCELTHLPRRPIDPDRARAQHRGYQAALRDAGVEVLELPADPTPPD